MLLKSNKLFELIKHLYFGWYIFISIRIIINFLFDFYNLRKLIFKMRHRYPSSQNNSPLPKRRERSEIDYKTNLG